VREVANVIERAVLLHEGEEIGAGVLGLPALTRGGAPVEVGGGGGVKVDFSRGGLSLSELERTLIVEALKATGGNRRRAAQLLGISVETLRYRMEKHALTSVEHDSR
jgi:DNA-binding NtrC family response regulator